MPPAEWRSVRILWDEIDGAMLHDGVENSGRRAVHTVASSGHDLSYWVRSTIIEGSMASEVTGPREEHLRHNLPSLTLGGHPGGLTIPQSL